MQYIRNFIKNYWGLFLVIFISFWTIRPLFIPGFFPIHDDTQVARVFEMAQSLKDGMFPVRWVKDLGYGYGYPIFNFYAPLAYYIGAKYVLLGLDALIATKITIALAMIVAGIGMYVFVRRIANEIGGVLAATMYLFATYHAVDLYVRGDIAELWAYAFIPFVFWGMYQRNIKAFIIGSVAYASIILSHNLTAFMVTPYLLIFGFLLILKNKEKIQTALYMFLIAITGVLLSAFYWLPAIGEMKYTNVLSQIGGGANYMDHYVCLQQFWFSPWGYGGSAPGCIDGLSFALGKISFVLIGFILIGLFVALKRRTDRALYCFFLVGLLISFLLQTEYTKILWQNIPFMAFFQYPWRFLIMVSFFIAVGGGLAIKQFSLIKKRMTEVIGIILICAFVLTQIKIFIPQTILSVTANDYITRNTLLFETSRISDEYMPKNFKKPTDKNDVIKQVLVLPPSIGIVHEPSEKTHIKTAKITIDHPQSFIFPVAPFPGWKVMIDNIPVPIKDTDKGILVMLPQGDYIITLMYKQTQLEQIANTLSFSGIVVLFLGIMLVKRLNYGKATT